MAVGKKKKTSSVMQGIELRMRARDELNSGSPVALVIREAEQHSVHLRHHAAMHDINVDGRGDDSDWVAEDDLPASAGALRELFGRLAVSPVYRAWQSERADRLAHNLAASPLFQKAVRTWHNATPSQHRQTATWVSRQHQSVFTRDIIPRPHKVHISSFVKERTGPRLTRGYHVRSEVTDTIHTIGLNLHPDAGYQRPAQAMNVVFHENTHTVHHMLSTAFLTRAIANDHPLHDDAKRLMMVGFSPSCYMPGIKSLYRAHPAEEDTFRASDDFVARLETALAPRGLTLYPQAVAAP